MVARAGRVGLTGRLVWLGTRFAVFVIWPKTGRFWIVGFKANVGLIAGIVFWVFDEARNIKIVSSLVKILQGVTVVRYSYNGSRFKTSHLTFKPYMLI